MEKSQNQLAKVEWTLLKTSDRIKNEIVNGITIRQLQNIEPLKQSLRRVLALIGIREDQVPTKEEKQLLIDFIRRRYANYTAEEFVIAFEMAIAGDFKADLEHFGQFTAKYLSQVFNAYTSHRNKVSLQVQIEAERLRKIETEEEAQRKVDEFYGEAVDLYRNSSNGFEGSKYHANVLYDTLKTKYTDSELIAFKEMARLKMLDMKKNIQECKNKYLPIPQYLRSATFTRVEWKRQTALLVVNDALTKKTEL